MDLNQPAPIPVRSREQAMDWSLVLASQGIEPIIDNQEQAGGWQLIVPLGQREQALRILRQYKAENRKWPWRHEVVKSGILFDFGSLGWALLVILFFGLDQRLGLRSQGMMDSGAVAAGHWWRLFTATWLHADLGHLATNTTAGLLLLGLAMGRYGTGCGLLAAFLSGASGNVAGWLLDGETHRSLGASGLVMGSLGLVASSSAVHWLKLAPRARYATVGLLAGTMLFVLFGLSPGTDVIAHAGGFVAGLLLGLALSLDEKLGDRVGVQLICLSAAALAVVVPWWCVIARLRTP